MILSTTPSIDGKIASVYLGIIAAEVIFGANFWKDAGAQITDFIGGRNKDYEKVFGDARREALASLERQAEHRGANAVVNVRFDYQILGQTNGMLMVAATGTAVVVNLSKEEQAIEDARLQENAELYLVEIGDRARGPFSLAQLRALLATGNITEGAITRTEVGNPGPTVAALLHSKN